MRFSVINVCLCLCTLSAVAGASPHHEKPDKGCDEVDPAEGPLRVTAFIRRKPGTTEDEFQDYWLNHHGPLVSPILAKLGIIEYRQVSGSSSPNPHKLASD